MNSPCGALARCRHLIEWDQDFPMLETLVAEADKARAIIRNAAEERIPHAAE
jgi:uncharacterized protein (UPF0276 family)